MHCESHHSVQEIIECQKHASVGAMPGSCAEGKEGEGLHHGNIRALGNSKPIFVVAYFSGDMIVRDTGDEAGHGQYYAFILVLVLTEEELARLTQFDTLSPIKSTILPK